MTLTIRSGHRGVYCDDGYDWLERESGAGATSISSWGRDGWDAGSWPLVAFTKRTLDDGRLRITEHVEGDLTVVEGPVDEVHAWADQAIAFHWLIGQSHGPGEIVDALRQHLYGRDRGHNFWGLDGVTDGGQLWDIHRLVHHDLAISEGRVEARPPQEHDHPDFPVRLVPVLAPGELVDGWMRPEWRGPFSWARLEAEKSA